jgi:hypothetical protein
MDLPLFLALFHVCMCFITIFIAYIVLGATVVVMYLSTFLKKKGKVVPVLN